MQVLLIQLPVSVVDLSRFIAMMGGVRSGIVIGEVVPLVMSETLVPVHYHDPGVLEALALMKTGAFKEVEENEVKMPFPKARTRRRDQHRCSQSRLRQITSHGRPRFHRRVIG
jgi:hypothetical protein